MTNQEIIDKIKEIKDIAFKLHLEASNAGIWSPLEEAYQELALAQRRAEELEALRMASKTNKKGRK